MDTIHSCRVCGKRYRLYGMCVYRGDLSLCGACREAQERAIAGPDTDEQRRRRAEAFGAAEVRK